MTNEVIQPYIENNSIRYDETRMENQGEKSLVLE